MPTFDSDLPTALRRAQHAVATALARCSLAVIEGDVDMAYIGYIETIMWVTALDELFTITDNAYVARRDADPGGQIVRAVAWARDKGLHEVATLHGRRPRSDGDGHFGPEFRDGQVIVWLPLDEVSLRTEKPGGHLDRKWYSERLASRGVWDTLKEARNFLWWRAAATPPAPSVAI